MRPAFACDHRQRIVFGATPNRSCSRAVLHRLRFCSRPSSAVVYRPHRRASPWRPHRRPCRGRGRRNPGVRPYRLSSASPPCGDFSAQSGALAARGWRCGLEAWSWCCGRQWSGQAPEGLNRHPNRNHGRGSLAVPSIGMGLLLKAAFPFPLGGIPKSSRVESVGLQVQVGFKKGRGVDSWIPGCWRGPRKVRVLVASAGCNVYVASKECRVLGRVLIDQQLL